MNPCSAALALSLSLTLLPAALGAQSRDLRDRIPASAWGYVQFEGLEACRAAFARLPEKAPFLALMKTLKEKGLLAPMKDGLQMGMDQMSDGMGSLGHSTAEFRALASRPMVLVVGRPTLISEGMFPSMMLMVDVAKAEQEARSLLETLAMLSTTMGEASLIDLRQPKMTVARFRRGPGKVAWTIQDKVLYVSLGTGLLRESLATGAGKNAALRLPPMLQKTEDGLGSKPQISLYLDLRKVEKSLGWLMPYEAVEIGRILGIRGIEGLYWGGAASEKGFLDIYQILVPGNKDGLVQGLFSQPTQCAAARLAAKDTLLFGSYQVDTRRLTDAIREVFPLLPPEAQDEAERNFLRGNRELQQRLGMDFKELTQQFAGEWSLALQAPRGSELIPDLLLFVPVQDPDKMLGMVKNLLQMAPEVKFRDQKVGDEHVYVISLPKKVKRKMPLTPAFTFKNGFMIWSLNARSLKNQARHWPTPEESYAGSPAFQKLRRGDQGASSLIHLHLKTGFSLLWDNKQLMGMALMGINQENPDLNLSLDDLPTSEQLAPLFQDASISSVWNETGLHTRMENYPLSYTRVLVYGASFFDWFLEQTIKNEIR